MLQHVIDNGVIVCTTFDVHIAIDRFRERCKANPEHDVRVVAAIYTHVGQNTPSLHDIYNGNTTFNYVAHALTRTGPSDTMLDFRTLCGTPISVNIKEDVVLHGVPGIVTADKCNVTCLKCQNKITHIIKEHYATQKD